MQYNSIIGIFVQLSFFFSIFVPNYNTRQLKHYDSKTISQFDIIMPIWNLHKYQCRKYRKQIQSKKYLHNQWIAR